MNSNHHYSITTSLPDEKCNLVKVHVKRGADKVAVFLGTEAEASANADLFTGAHKLQPLLRSLYNTLRGSREIPIGERLEMVTRLEEVLGIRINGH